MNERRFQVFKQSVCGNQIKRDYQLNLTFEQARCLDTYPSGIQTDGIGDFTWGYSVMGLK